MEKENHEFMFKLGMFEQQIRQIQQQLQIIEQSILDISSINFGLDEIMGSEGKEILAPVGRGIFVKTKLLSDNLTVDIGNKTFVKKSVPETKEIIESQIKKLDNIRKELEAKLDEINEELTKTILEAEEKKS